MSSSRFTIPNSQRSRRLSPMTLKCNAQQQYYALPFQALLLSFATAQIAIKPNKVVFTSLNNTHADTVKVLIAVHFIPLRPCRRRTNRFKQTQ